MHAPTVTVRRRLRAATALVAVLAMVTAGLLAAPPAMAAEPPEGATWQQTFIDTPDGERLHADVLRPEGLSDDDTTPVILIVSPYIGTTTFGQPGPSDRFYDFIEGADVFDRGYSVVMVSLRGTGGSSGCLDILGPGEQTDVTTAVNWAASQPWSTGKVGMYGKSYDANTGVVGAALQPDGLAAVVAQQIAPDRYRGAYSDRVRLLQSLAYPAIYGVNGEGAFSVNNDPEYIANSVSRGADCQPLLAEHYLEDETREFWRVRDFVERADDSTVPTFITTGYLDPATNIGAGAVDFYNALDGPKRMWIGWWDHVRGNDTTAGGQLAMGRPGFFEEVMRFFDHHVKGLPLGQAPTHRDPTIAAQSSDGDWRAETAFPPADAETLQAALLAGSYPDDGTNRGSRDAAAGPGGIGSPGRSPTYGNGAWTFSPPLDHTVHVTGIPSATVDVVPQVPRTNVVVNVYDVAPDGRATMITRGAAMADTAGTEDVALWPTDWTFEAGHRIGLLVSGANAEAYSHVVTDTEVQVAGGTVALPWLAHRREADLAGDIAPRLEAWRQQAPFTVDEATIEERTDPTFPQPPPQQPPPGQRSPAAHNGAGAEGVLAR